MKKALVMTFVLVLGLGFAAFAAGALSGTWSVTVSFDPTATVFTDLVSFSSDLEIDYTIGGWAFVSISGFSNDGYDAQSFTAGGIVGAFTFSSTMNFLPMGLASEDTAYSYGLSIYEDDIDTNNDGVADYWTPYWLSTVVETTTVTDVYTVAFDDWTVEGSVSIAGVSFEALFFMEYWAGTTETETIPVYEYEWISRLLPPVRPVTALLDSDAAAEFMPQTASYTVDNSDLVNVGAGWRFKAAGSFGDVTLTSYTYFNLIEGFAMDDDPDTKSFARNGDFEPEYADQVVSFTEEYITLEGLSLGCVTLDAALRVTCVEGFEYFALWFKDIYLMCCGVTVDFEIDFGVASKTVELFPTITTDWTCIEPTIELDLSADKSIINGFKLTALGAEIALNGITFESNTIFDSSDFGEVDSGNTQDWYFLVPSVLYNATNQNIALVTLAPGFKQGIYPVLLVPPIPTPIVNDVGTGIYEVQKVSFANDYYETFEDFTITVDGDSCCGGAFEISLQTWFGTHYTETLAEWGYWYETNARAIPGGVVVGTGMDHGQGFYFDRAGVAGPANTWYFYDDDLGTWIPFNNLVPTVPVDIAYSTLIGAGSVPFVYPITAVVEMIGSNYSTTKTPVANSLFGWAKSTVATTIGVGSNFTLSFGFTIDAYGWNGVDFGFEFTF